MDMRLSTRYYIYTYPEIALISSIFLFSSLFFFTLGMHIGKKIYSIRQIQATEPLSLIEAIPDKLPSEQELFENKENFSNDLHKLIASELFNEVKSTHIKIKKNHPLHFPEKAQYEEVK